DRLGAPLGVLGGRAPAATDSDYQVSVGGGSRWEQAYGHIPAGAVVVAHTGWKAPEVLPKSPPEHPAFSMDAVQFLARARGIYGIGIDAPAVDLAASSEMPVRTYLGQQHIYGLANVANLDHASAAGAVVVVAP